MQISKLLQFSILLTITSCGTVEVIDGNLDGDGGIGGNPAVAPIIASITPLSGPLDGGNEITVTGENLSGDLTVVMNGKEVSEVSSPDETTLTFAAPSGSRAGQIADIYVYGESGFGILKAAYTYNAPPTLESVFPSFAPLAGGTELVLHGTGFLDDNPGTPTVLIGEVPATEVAVVDNNTITAISPAAGTELVATLQDVVIETSNGNASLEEQFVFGRPGLLIGTRAETGELSFGISYLDIPTGRIAKIASLTSGVGRMEQLPGRGLVVRRSRIGALFSNNGRNMLSIIDLRDNTVEDLGPLKDGNTTRTITGMAMVNGQLRALDQNSRINNVDIVEGTLSQIGANTAGNPSRGCLASNGTGAAFHMDSSTGLLSTFNLSTGVFTPGPSLSGIPSGEFGGELRCHGATTLGGQLFALFVEQRAGTPSTGSIVRVGLDGDTTVVANLADGFGGLSATPADF